MKQTQEHKELVDILKHFSHNMDERLDSMDRRFEKIDKRFEKIDQRFEQIDRRFEQIDKRFAQMDHRFDGMDHRFERIEKRLEKTATKEDLQRTERAIRKDMATKKDVKNAIVRGDLRLNMLTGKLVAKRVFAPAEVVDILQFDPIAT
ncbi:MAG: hypothetical protein RL141_599 [Candidatus Parcubacteria bacterium]|jgi:hypothetical protein